MVYTDAHICTERFYHNSDIQTSILDLRKEGRKEGALFYNIGQTSLPPSIHPRLKPGLSQDVLNLGLIKLNNT
jgi:hypothetical protein